MTHDMKKTLMRMLTLMLLMMFSMGAYADVKVLFGENGDDVFSGKGGTIEVSQEPDEKDETKVIVTLTVTPKKNYSISKDDIKVYAVLPASVRSTRGLEISNELTLDGKDPQNLSEKRDYTVTLDSKLNLWVRTATFTNLRKGGEITVTYHIINLGRLDESGQLGNERTEALQFTVTGNDVTVGMPDNYKSPLAKNFAYYNSSTLESSLNVGDALSDGADVYVTYELDEDAFSTVGVENGGIYRILFPDGKYFRQDNTYEKNANSYEYDSTKDSQFLLQLNIIDPYQITIQTKSQSNDNCFDYYLSSTSGGNLGDVRFVNGLSTAKSRKVWAFALLNGDTDGTYRLVVADGWKQTANANGLDQFGHGYLNNLDAGYKIRYQKYGGSAYSGCDLRFIPLKANYTYNIVDTHGHIAIKYTVNNQDVGLALNNDYTSIPEAIRSPYLEDETVTFYKAFTEGSRDNLLDANVIESTPAVERNIYVSYTTDHLNDDDRPLRLNGSNPFMIKVNGEFVYDENKNLMHSESGVEDADNYRWLVQGSDPYRVQIQNVKNSTHRFKWSIDPSASLTLGTASNFIIFGGGARPDGLSDDVKGPVELMAATGEDLSSNAYYNVGLDSDIRLLASDTYGHGDDAIQVLLKGVKRITTFHIIDMSGRIVVEQSGEFDELAVPTAWRSPLVDEDHYHFYKHEDFRVSNGVYTLRSGVSEIDDFNAAPVDIYVTYEPNDDYDLDGSENRATDGKKYLLKFVSGTKFNQEKDDGFETTEDWGIYPYINGEGGLFVYGQDKLDATEGAVGSTRTRWAWYLEGGDPYRLRISSLQTKTDGKEESHHSYLRTYKPKGYTEVVTGVISNNPIVYDDSDDAHAERHKPTDYMILNNSTGTHLRLVTSDVVDDYDDETVDVRHTVTSFENYWKTNPTAAQIIHDYYENDGDDQTSFAVGNTPTEEQITAALTTGEGAIGWHSYNVWANGSTWASSSKSFGYGPHWFKTIGVGSETETEGVYNGDFDLVEYDLDGALILLDQHGWEVMRKPITNRSSDKQAYADELRKYDSPMVKKYHFWTNFRKDDGYHKYKPIRDQSDSKKNAQHKGVGTSLADYPEVFSGGTLSDIYVTYEVMATYRDGYKPKAENQNERVSKYLIRQGENYAKTTDGTNITLEPVADVPDVSAADPELLWYVKPNVNIDTEMGYHYSGDGVAKYGEKSQADTESDYYTNTTEEAVYDKTNGQNGFDPYNLQIESVAQSGKLFTTNATGAGLDNSGGLVSTYNEGAKTVTLQTKAQVFDIATNYYDSGTGYQIPHVTNSTFMAVGDANGNIRLMPRFDHHNVQTSLTILDEQGDAKPYGDEDGTQTTLFVHPSSTSPSPSGVPITIDSSDEITDMNGYYILNEGFAVTKVIGTSAKPFKGTIDGQLNTIDGIGRPLVAYAEGATIKNVIVKTVSINAGNADGNAGAICCQATGNTRIYNCGILPTTVLREDPDDKDKITGFSGSHVSGSANVGGIVGQISGTTRVINCFSYANVSGGSMMGGIVGNNTETSTMSSIKTIVVNCMFYGEISGGGPGTAYPVYGGTMIVNSGTTAINNYNYYRGESTFDDGYTDVAHFNRSWPAEEQNLTRFEYYRSILNSNRKLCTWWVNGTASTAPTDADVSSVGIAKWVLDPSIAPYPVLKEWGKYPSIINPDPEKVWNSVNNQWVQRTVAAPYQGKKLGELTIKVKTGSYPGTLTGLTEKEIEITRIVTDMDTLNYDYCYGKVQLPYYNEVFGNPSAADHLTRYYGNYTSKAVTAWKITAVTDDGRTRNSFVKSWENGYNYADRNCTAKDIYADNDGRAFAQGGYYYVPEGVKKIEIEAYWGTAFYLHGKDHYLDRVNVTNSKNYGTGFTPSGTLGDKLKIDDNSSHDISIYENFTTLMSAVKANKTCNVYDQAVVLVGNYPLHAQNDIDMGNSGQGGFTIMSADFDMDNEPDFCFPLQWRNNYDRRPIMPVRFDFLPIPELGLAMRHNSYAYAIGIFVPQGHFEITETSFMHTTQFEYMSTSVSAVQHPLIFNGGEFEQIVAHGNNNGINNCPVLTSTRNIILGGHVWMKRFTPGSHTGQHSKVRHCAISVMGGDYPEFYLTGIYWAAVDVANAYDDNPRCYTNGGRFGIMAGAGMEAVKNSVYFEIDHSVIDEFYGGGINSNNPVGGNINVTINNSLVLEKYCGGPKVGTSGTVTTNAEGTVFNQYFGGGNGGTNLFRQQIKDLTPNDMPSETVWRGSGTNDYMFDNFTPISNAGETATYNADYGYHAEFEFEVFNQSNGINASAVARTYRHWAQFGTTQTGAVTNNLTGCTVKDNYYSAGNLGNVNGTVESTLTDCTLLRNAFGAGFSASIPHFPVHDKNQVTFPYRDKAGVCHNGKVEYRKDGNEIRQYTWCYKNPTTNVVTPAGVVIPDGVNTSKPAFQDEDGNWYCYTTVSLENLGIVTGNVTLTLDGNTVVGTAGDSETGNVYGGGDDSAVGQLDSNPNDDTDDSIIANTTVNLQGNTRVLGNVFGGGNEGLVNGSATVNIRPETPTTPTPSPSRASNGSSEGTGEGSSSGN